MDDNTITRYEDVEIDDIPRNLRFYPSDPSQAHTLSSERIEAYNRDGYIKGMRIFSGEEIDDIRSYFDALTARVLNQAAIPTLYPPHTCTTVAYGICSTTSASLRT